MFEKLSNGIHAKLLVFYPIEFFALDFARFHRLKSCLIRFGFAEIDFLALFKFN